MNVELKMDLIFHEKQSGSLCAQHCLNALLQEAYFTVFDLADLAKGLDESERQYMAEAGSNTREYQDFLQQPSSNYDDSGFFSIQVLQKALDVWNLSLIPFNSANPISVAARSNPNSQDAFICNFRQHWFTIRKIGNQWFNLNSLLSFPELLSNTYLGLFLKQLQVEGYSIFVVKGDIPDCPANAVLRLTPATQAVKPSLLNQTAPQSTTSAEDDPEEDQQLMWALEQSRRIVDDNDVSLNNALILSANEALSPSSSAPKPEQTVDASDLRLRRQAFLDKIEAEKKTIDKSGGS